MVISPSPSSLPPNILPCSSLLISVEANGIFTVDQIAYLGVIYGNVFFFHLTNTKRNLISCTSKYTQNLITSYYLQRYRCSLNHHQLLPALTILTGLFVSTPHFHLLSFISFSMLTAKVMLLEKVKPFQYILKFLDHFSLSFVPSVWKGHVMSFNFLSLYSNITYCHPHLNSGKKKSPNYLDSCYPNLSFITLIIFQYTVCILCCGIQIPLNN